MFVIIAQLSPAIILANVVSGKRPALSDDDCRRGIKELILRCWDPEPDVRLSFRGKEISGCKDESLCYLSCVGEPIDWHFVFRNCDYV